MVDLIHQVLPRVSTLQAEFVLIALGVLLLGCVAYFCTRWTEWLSLILAAALYVVPFVLKGH
ncbi:MAG TPA: hypothetical protein VIL86_12470 [Tepidisphaeraceae bacterium]|jgi:hypothetical protein